MKNIENRQDRRDIFFTLMDQGLVLTDQFLELSRIIKTVENDEIKDSINSVISSIHKSQTAILEAVKSINF